MEQNQVFCPLCRSDKVRKFVYRNIIDELKTEEEMKEFEKLYAVGGCVIGENSPEYHCDGCDKNFGKFRGRP